ncbi:unnamed protein product [Penicillium salamii]|uniref:Dienelactone hydrolase domain-containing protein n=1 Tax=Penicillium salamii TaxID=1612424 RepID=A0A9W4N300_9EURO|nr:unnamed protein product [Penicillium salamii]CAG8240299.1 unnamed protein product [Penicillium salamii]CAG8247653.1 unnamed protein product [Penicillium salamii]CAG8268809.1 unnamed protein product [Penicillium salamii]CAG8352531.1 unnamed protein product [Penicillium salamii]
MPPPFRLPQRSPVPALTFSTRNATACSFLRPLSSASRPLGSSSFLNSPSKCIRATPHHSQIRAMSTMEATNGHNKACCNVPPVVSSHYVAKGSYSQLGGLKTYSSGPENTTKGIVIISDIFGFSDQALQGADILATSHRHQHKTFIPDWFEGSPCPSEWFPPDTEQKQKDLGAWFGNHMPQGPAAALPQYVAALKAANPSIESWALVGFCWGGKVAEIITSGGENPFAIAATCHPAMIDPSGAENISVPFMLLAAGEDPAEDVNKFESQLKVPHHVETFTDQVHGWMAARADLSDPHVRDEYARGYKTVLDFFEKHWI